MAITRRIMLLTVFNDLKVDIQFFGIRISVNILPLHAICVSSINSSAPVRVRIYPIHFFSYLIYDRRETWCKIVYHVVLYSYYTLDILP